MSARRQARVIAVASGKGGVGKSAVAVNLSVALARLGRRTMLVDRDLGVANAAIMLGHRPEATLEDFITGQLPLDAIVAEGPDGLLLVPGGTGIGMPPTIGRSERRRLADGFRPYAETLDTVIVDTPSGISRETMELLALSDRILLVLSSEPTAFMDAYATVKLLTLHHGCTSVSVVANMVDSEVSGRDLFRRFRDVAARFLPSELDYLGAIPRDEHMRMAVLQKRPCIDAFPASRASAAIGRLARALDEIDLPSCSGGSRFFGLEIMHA